jgi:hypothetical protein
MGGFGGGEVGGGGDSGDSGDSGVCRGAALPTRGLARGNRAERSSEMKYQIAWDTESGAGSACIDTDESAEVVLAAAAAIVRRVETTLSEAGTSSRVYSVTVDALDEDAPIPYVLPEVSDVQ